MIAADTASELSTEQAAVLDAALENAAQGRAVLPLHGIDADGRCTCGRPDCASPGKHPRTAHGCKDATTDELKIRLNWRRWPDANVGIATGAVSRLVVIDIDPRHGGLESARELAARYGAPPPTMEVATGGGGLHLYFDHPGGKVPNSTSKIAPGIDVRGDGGFVVAPPSLHVSGKRYTWRGQCPDRPKTMPQWLIDLTRAGKEQRDDRIIRLDNGEHWLAQALERAREGNRNEVGLWLACQLRDNGVGEVEARGSMLQYAARCPAGASAYTPAEAMATLKSAYSTPAREPARARHSNADAPDAEHPPFTEYGNAQRLVQEHGDDLRYSPNRGAWLCWDGKRFGPDETGNAERCAKRVARQFWKIAMNTADPIRRGDIIKHAIRAEKNAGIEAMLRLARSEPGIAVTSADLDTDPFLLNVLNGTIDLRTGELRPHRQSDLITKLAPVEYRPNAPAPLWDRFLDRIMAGNREMIAYLARIAGLCLTGEISQQELFIFWGGGCNGKNVLLDSLVGMLGDHAGAAPDSLLVVRSHDEHPTEIADLCGKRLVVASELEESARLRVALVKRLTGDQTLKARFMRQDYFEFRRTHKTILVTNNKPLIRENTHAIWRRIRLVPFTVTIPECERDPQLTQKLRAEWPGILAWAVNGCLAWQRDGMNPPHEVLVASASYQAEQDVLSEFLADRCVRGERCRVSRNDLFMAYQSWAKQTGETHPLDRTALFERMRRVSGVEDAQWRQAGLTVPLRGFKGLGLAIEPEVTHEA